MKARNRQRAPFAHQMPIIMQSRQNSHHWERANRSLTFLNEPIKLHTDESMPYSLLYSLSAPTTPGTYDGLPGERVQKSFLSCILSFPGRVLSSILCRSLSPKTVSQSLASCGHVRFGALLASRRGVSSYLHRALVSVQFSFPGVLSLFLKENCKSDKEEVRILLVSVENNRCVWPFS